MTTAVILEFLSKYWKVGVIGLAGLVLGMYIHSLKHTITVQDGKLTADQQTIADLRAGVAVQNAAIEQQAKYAQQKQAELADATRLAEALQDSVDLKSQQILNAQTKIDGSIATLADCQSEIARIKGYMINAEGRIREQVK